ncbi:MAG TPA: aldose 1-epimerase family protein [Marmoricola sp.]
MSGAASWQISGGGYRAVVLEAGGGLGDVWYDDVRIVAGSDPAGAVSAARGQILVPWPNRLRDGRFSYAGQTHQVALSEPGLDNAIHGLARWHTWRLRERTDSSIRLGCRLPARSGYPWTLDLTVAYAVGEDGLTITLGAQNISSTPAPFAAGMHPYLDAGAPADDCTLHLAATTHQLVDDRLLPTATEETGPASGFDPPRALHGVVLDDAFTGLARDDSGWTRVRLEGRHAVEVSADAAWPWVQVFTGDTLSSAEARATVAIEPMTAPADAFNSGTDLVELRPGTPWSGTFRISWAETSSPR